MENETTKMSSVQVLKKFFEDSSRPLQMAELRDLSKDDRHELAQLAAIELGVELK
jgi:hypothetical protein